MTTKIRNKYREMFCTEAKVFKAPGRINLIGEHTDYNGGFVLPGAIDKGIYVAVNKNGSNKVSIYAMDLNQSYQFTIGDNKIPEKNWAKYIYGVVCEIGKFGKTVSGFDAVFSGNIPLGAGLSSSAALESAFGFALNDIFDLKISLLDIAKIGQTTEHAYLGVKCGIMDQFASCYGKKGNLICLDCRSLDFEYIPFDPKGYKLFLIDTCVKHELASSAYNKRRESCENVVYEISKNHKNVKHLRDADIKMLDEVKNQISNEDYSRAHYVIDEISRLKETCKALKQGDYEKVGRLMYSTHKGLSKLYEVSCEELDFLAHEAESFGVTGCRMMGGGFGGCTINLIQEKMYDLFVSKMVSAFKNKFKISPKIYDIEISNGVEAI